MWLNPAINAYIEPNLHPMNKHVMNVSKSKLMQLTNPTLEWPILPMIRISEIPEVSSTTFCWFRHHVCHRNQTLRGEKCKKTLLKTSRPSPKKKKSITPTHAQDNPSHQKLWLMGQQRWKVLSIKTAHNYIPFLATQLQLVEVDLENWRFLLHLYEPANIPT